MQNWKSFSSRLIEFCTGIIQLIIKALQVVKYNYISWFFERNFERKEQLVVCYLIYWMWHSREIKTYTWDCFAIVSMFSIILLNTKEHLDSPHYMQSVKHIFPLHYKAAAWGFSSWKRVISGSHDCVLTSISSVLQILKSSDNLLHNCHPTQ